MHDLFLEAPSPCLPKAPPQLPPGRGEKAESDLFLALHLEMNDPGVFWGHYSFFTPQCWLHEDRSWEKHYEFGTKWQMKTEKGRRKKITHFCPRELPMEWRTSSLGPAHPIPGKEDPRTQQKAGGRGCGQWGEKILEKHVHVCLWWRLTTRI